MNTFDPERPEGAPGNPLGDRRFGAVLFDLDGTLIDSVAAMERSWIRWALEFGIDPVRLLGFHGVSGRGVVAALMPEASAAQQDAAFLRVEELEVCDTEGIVMLPGATEAIRALNAGGAAQAIVTSCTMPLAMARFAASGLVVPEVVVTADMVERGKPHPDPFLLAAQLLGADPGDCLVVEDAVAGLSSARDAGVGGALAVTRTTPAQELASWADLVVTGLDRVDFAVDRSGRVRVAERS